MLTKVTITGADSTTDIDHMRHLSEMYPFTEWGILVSRKNLGVAPRFPSKDWLAQLSIKAYDLPLSLHLCGAYVRELLTGNGTFILDEHHIWWPVFDRVQINTHGVPHDSDVDKLANILNTYSDKEFIFQYDEVNKNILESVMSLAGNISTLFDLSHGAGILPEYWPKPIANVKCGYAGGISPDNIATQIQMIENVVGDTEIWIDMETHVRTDNGYALDLKKVENCLELASKYVKTRVKCSTDVEQMEIIAGNVLIAKYMGAKPVFDKLGEVVDVVFPFPPNGHLGYSWVEDGLRYEIEWNWLMPVIKRIVSYYAYSELANPAIDKAFTAIIAAVTCADKKSTWGAIVAYLKVADVGQ